MTFGTGPSYGTCAEDPDAVWVEAESAPSYRSFRMPQQTPLMKGTMIIMMIALVGCAAVYSAERRVPTDVTGAPDIDRLVDRKAGCVVEIGPTSSRVVMYEWIPKANDIVKRTTVGIFPIAASFDSLTETGGVNDVEENVRKVLAGTMLSAKSVVKAPPVGTVTATPGKFVGDLNKKIRAVEAGAKRAMHNAGIDLMADWDTALDFFGNKTWQDIVGGGDSLKKTIAHVIEKKKKAAEKALAEKKAEAEKKVEAVKKALAQKVEAAKKAAAEKEAEAEKKGGSGKESFS